jgi:hypothetical protein
MREMKEAQVPIARQVLTLVYYGLRDGELDSRQDSQLTVA